jgi:hypothetical protein
MGMIHIKLQNTQIRILCGFILHKCILNSNHSWEPLTLLWAEILLLGGKKEEMGIGCDV